MPGANSKPRSKRLQPDRNPAPMQPRRATATSVSPRAISGWEGDASGTLHDSAAQRLIAVVFRLFCAACLSVVFGDASELPGLASLDGAPGDESRVIEFISQRIEGRSRLGSGGSLVVEFGNGPPSTLLIAGVDEPGLVVSGIHEEGYLHAVPLVDSSFREGLTNRFRGQHVNVSTKSGEILPGVVASSSVHFASIGTARPHGADGLFVDIGASNAAQARRAGASILDRVTLAKQPAFVSPGWLASPWISSRVGAAILLELAARLASESFPGSVTLAFVTQQYPGNAGLARTLRSVRADRVVLLAPNGHSFPGVASLPAQDDALVLEIRSLAERIGLDLERRAAHRLDLGPFADRDIWPSNQRAAVLLPAVRNRMTPAEVVSLSDSSSLASVLELLVGLEARPVTMPAGDGGVSGFAKRPGAQETDSFRRMLRELVGIASVSGREEAVRESLLRLLPRRVAESSRTDGKGNLIVHLGAEEPAAAIFLAHMDEIGFVVRSITSSGAVSADSRGGGDPNLVEWQPASVHGSQGVLPALMTRSGVLEFGGLTGADIRNLGVLEGSSVTVPKRFRALLGKRVSARSLDDRLGCAVLVEAIRRLEGVARRSRNSVAFAFTVEEEVGLIGARHLASRLTPARVYPVDTFVTSDTPLEPRQLAYARLGAGPVLRALDESGSTARSEVARVTALARKHKIPIQVGVTAGGNDGSAFVSMESSNVPIGFPLRYAHTPVETADLGDAEAAIDLIEVLALDALR